VVAAVFLKGGDTSTTIMSISENGYGKRTQSRLYKLQSRGGMGVINFRITNKTGDVVSAMPVTENDGLAMLTSNNKIVRIGVSEVSSTGRSTMGVKCVNLDGGARVVACDRIDNGGIVANSMDGGEDADTRGDRG
jgi:DNA gyrase subunit A